MHVAPDVFLVPDDGAGSWILYAPLLELAMHVDAATAALVKRLQADRDAPVADQERAALAVLQDQMVVSATPYPELRPDSRSAGFVPTSVTLFLTSRCNLGCSYCYASANENPRSMTWPLARRALDLVFDNAARDGAHAVGVVLHGGGEVTLEWELLTRIHAYCVERARAGGVHAHLSLGTNGVLPASRARWLAEHFGAATVSVDGPRDVHDRNRPTVGGRGSYDVVARTLRIFDEHGFAYGVRMTVTDDWVDRLPEAVQSIMDACQVREIQAEPVFQVGRAQRSAARSPTGRRFIEAFRAAGAVARARGVRLTYSGARLGIVTDRFCEAVGRSFSVTPDGDVSSCYEVSEATDERADRFFWGRYDAERERFELDEDARRSQLAFAVHDKPSCESCFAKWHCAGDCAAKISHQSGYDGPGQSPRCEVNRALTRDQLVRALRHGPDALSDARPACADPTPAPTVGEGSA